MTIIVRWMLTVSTLVLVCISLLVCNYSIPNDCNVYKSKSKKYTIDFLIDQSFRDTNEHEFLKKNPGCMRLVISRMRNDTCLIEVVKTSDSLGQHETEKYLVTPDLNKFYTEIIVENRNRIIDISYSFSGLPVFTYSSGLKEKYWNIQTYYGFAPNKLFDFKSNRTYHDSSTVNLRFFVTGTILNN